MNAGKRAQIFQRLQAANPDPTTELRYGSPFELLIAVILSAQATDVSVNKATKQLFPVARTRIRYFQRAITMRFENTFDNRELEFIKVPGTVALSSLPGATAQLDFTLNPTVWSSITQLISRYGISRYHRVEVSFNPAFAYGGDFWGHDIRATTSFWVYAQSYGYYLSRGIGTALL